MDARNMDFKKATLQQLVAIMNDETEGAGVRYRARKEIERREAGSFKHRLKYPPSAVQKWAREKAGISIENNFRVGKLK